jgi:hypothetical protein
MVAPNPVDVLTRRVREALATLFVESFAESFRADSDPPPPADRSSRTEQQRYRLDVLASVTLGLVWGAPLLATAVSAAFEWYTRHPTGLEGFTRGIRAALAEMVRHLDDLVRRGDLSAAEADLPLVRDAAAGRTGPESLGSAVEKAIGLFRTGADAPWRRRYEADCRTPYFVPVDAATVYAAVIRPDGYRQDEWEYDLGSLSPDLATARRRGSAGFYALDDDLLIGFAEVSLVPATGWEGARQTDVCDTAVRQAGQRESYDLHSFTVSGAGISDTVGDYPTEPHPAGPIVREATVRLVLVRHIPLEPDCASSSAPKTAQRGLA